ncbi:hypothetical protein PHLGIDRAFT_297841 [Phlebiopsis gigantea 11061_1 CR5-6]|uniref:Uncharacterized protein n=1 Tax=Phlebiopsis gigantea (strain 11061_1 CR5-6) TaxID=745531 RepID=A0A0C3S3F9_PHLG1|nr:hypothetical protein PHLGIDRAFT_297841 [Phlebiopsis gigantea 11061_1 CR5-6]
MLLHPPSLTVFTPASRPTRDGITPPSVPAGQRAPILAADPRSSTPAPSPRGGCLDRQARLAGLCPSRRPGCIGIRRVAGARVCALPAAAGRAHCVRLRAWRAGAPWGPLWDGVGGCVSVWMGVAVARCSARLSRSGAGLGDLQGAI